MEFNRTIGNKNLIVPGLAQKYHSLDRGVEGYGENFQRNRR